MATRDPKDIARIRELIDMGVLVDEQPGDFDHCDGMILIACGDGDQSKDIFNHECQFTNRIHLLCLNGGGFLLSPRAEVVIGDAKDSLLIEEIKRTFLLKKIHTIAPLVHYPCGMAGMFHISFDDKLRYNVEGAQKVARALSPFAEPIRVIPLLHVDYGNERRRTYLINGAHAFFQAGEQYASPVAASSLPQSP